MTSVWKYSETDALIPLEHLHVSAIFSQTDSIMQVFDNEDYSKNSDVWDPLECNAMYSYH